MDRLKGLEPQKVFEFFEYISSVPRGSGNTDAVSDLCVKFAKDRGLTCIKDKVNNVVIYKPATPGYENSPTLILQGHLDMVCTKTADCTKDMATEPIDLTHDDQYVYAVNTTLGGDDGIAIAYALAILDADDIKHPAIEAVFTIDEEVGMDGAKYIDGRLISGRKLLNIDSEAEGVFTCGCAGGCRVDCEIPVNKELKGDNAEDLVAVSIELGGLKGGHSGSEIHNQPASANYLIARVLRDLLDTVEFNLVSLSGGKFDNVICEAAKSVVSINKYDLQKLKEFISEYDKDLKTEYSFVNPEIKLTANEAEFNGTFLDKSSTLNVLNAVTLLHQGVIEMNMEVKGSVQTSQNIGVIKLNDDCFKIGILVRSTIESQKDSAIARIRSLIELFNGTISLFGDYPGWKYRTDSPLRDTVVKAYRDCYGKAPVIDVIHAGLECGLFIDKLDGLDAISFGPDILDIHSPNERLSIASVGRVWKMLLHILEESK